MKPSCKIPLTLASVTSDQIKVILSIAKNLQTNYDRLNVASTQNVRNPLPMRTLVLTMTPRKQSEAVTREGIRAKIRAAGYAVGDINFSLSLSSLLRAGIILTDHPVPKSKFAQFYMKA